MQGNKKWRKRLRIQDRNEEMKEENDNPIQQTENQNWRKRLW
jgi:hypothetical protein